jgi:uncharacterized protein YxeA
MKKILLVLIVSSSIVFASTIAKKDKQSRLDKQIKIEMEKEKKYANEQTFYQGNNYDLKGAEVNLESLPSLNHIEVDELDMDSVYD